MALYDIKLTDNSVSYQIPDASVKFDKIFGGGMTQNFGGIGDSPGGKWTWIYVAVGVLVIGGTVYLLIGRKRRT